MADSFLAHLAEGEARGGFQTDDVLAAMLPLLRQIARFHSLDLVAPLEGLAAVTVSDTGALHLAGDGLTPRNQKERVEALQRPIVSALRVVGQGRLTADTDEGLSWQDMRVGEAGGDITRPAYLPGY